MTVADFLKKTARFPEEVDIFIADTNITTWPIQIPIEKIEFDNKLKTVNLHATDNQSVLPGEVMEKMLYSNYEA